MHKDENLLIEDKYLVIEQSSKSWNTHHSSSETRGRSLVCNCLGKTEFSIELAPIHRTCKFSADMRSAVGCGRRVQACPPRADDLLLLVRRYVTQHSQDIMSRRRSHDALTIHCNCNTPVGLWTVARALRTQSTLTPT